MIARYLRWTVLAVLLVWLCCAVQAIRSLDWWWIAVLPGAAMLLHASALVFELSLQRAVSRRAGVASFSLMALPAIAVREMVSAWRAFLWDIPFGADRYADSIASGVGVVLVHGLFCNRGIWNGWMAELRRRHIPVIAINLEPPFASIETYIETVESAVDWLTEATGRRPVIVGHSMGGLAARAWLASGDCEDRVEHVVTIGSPHHGTVLGQFSRATNVRQMARGSAWLAELEKREPVGRASRFTCFHSRCDNVIVPWTSARLPGADNREVAGTPHVSMLHAPEVLAEVLRLIESTHSFASRTPASISGRDRTSP